MDYFILKVRRGPEIHRVPLEIMGTPDFRIVDLAVRRIWPDVGAHLAWYHSENGGVYVLEEPIFSDFLATARITDVGRVLKLELPSQACSPTFRPSPSTVAIGRGDVASLPAIEIPDSHDMSELQEPPRIRISSEEYRYWTCPMCDEINREDRDHCNNCNLLIPPELWNQSTANNAPLPCWVPSAPPLPELADNSDAIEAASSTDPASASTKDAHAPLYVGIPKLYRISSEALLGRWLDKDRGIHAAMPEYQVAAQRICIAPELMSSSRLWKHLKFLKQQKAVVAAYEEIVITIIHKACNTRFRWAARYKTANISGLGSGNLLQGAMSYYQALQWERPYLVQALDLLHKTEDPDGLQVILGLMLSGSGWCHARKTFVFNTIVSRVKVPAGAIEEAWTRADESPELQTARQAIMEIVTDFIEDTKDHALKSTFLEPTKMHFRAADEPVRENQVDVHGANTFLAILSATLGVQLNRRPYLRDYSIGCVDFLADDAAEPTAWSESHFGRDWEGVRELRDGGEFGEQGPKPLRKPGIFDRIEFFADTCILQSRTGFVFSGGTAREVANASVNPAGRSEKRLHLARYLEKFASWFSKDFILPRMISRITGDAGRVEALQVFLDDLLIIEPELAGEDGEEDVRFWLWDMSEIPAQFRTKRAARLMQHVGVLRAGIDASSAELSEDLQSQRRHVSLGTS